MRTSLKILRNVISKYTKHPEAIGEIDLLIEEVRRKRDVLESQFKIGPHSRAYMLLQFLNELLGEGDNQGGEG